MYVPLNCLARRGRDILAPQSLDQLSGRDRPPLCTNEERQNQPLLGATEGKVVPIEGHSDRSEHLEAHVGNILVCLHQPSMSPAGWRTV
jgi:hypothetical protein